MTTKLEVKDLQVGWSNRVVAVLPELVVEGGQIVVLAGPNGAGKSTALKTIARQNKSIGGSATISGADLFGLTHREFAQKLAYVPQLIEAPRGLTVYDLVLLGRNPHQTWWSWETSPVDRDAVQQALDQTEMSELSGRYVTDLSGGERQRAAIAMALAQQTPFLLLDEPTAHLDFKHQMQLLSLLARLKEQNLGVLLVLHDLNLIGRIADQVVLLEKPAHGPSTIAASGTPESVLTETILQKVYEVAVAISVDAHTGIKTYTPLPTAS